jgi:glutamate-1-semialdehyde 2,1-aminomutase
MSYFKQIHHELLERGIYLGPSGYEVGFISAAHTPDDLAWAGNHIKEVLDLVFG